MLQSSVPSLCVSLLGILKKRRTTFVTCSLHTGWQPLGRSGTAILEASMRRTNRERGQAASCFGALYKMLTLHSQVQLRVVQKDNMDYWGKHLRKNMSNNLYGRNTHKFQRSSRSCCTVYFRERQQQQS